MRASTQSASVSVMICDVSDDLPGHPTLPITISAARNCSSLLSICTTAAAAVVAASLRDCRLLACVRARAFGVHD